MPYDINGVFTPVSGATNAFPGEIIHSATWNNIHSDIATALTELGEKAWDIFKAPVACATTANISLSGEQTIDGVTTATSRVLVKNQTTASQNGIYLSAAGAWTRATDANTNGFLVQGTSVAVEGGTVNKGLTFSISTANPITLGTTAITWVAGATGAAMDVTATVVASITVPAGTNIIRTTGYSTAGDNGDATYYRVGSLPTNPGYLTDASGAYFQLFGLAVNVKALGAKGDNSADDSTAIMNAYTTAGATGIGVVEFPPGNYKCTPQVFNAYNDITFQGSSATIPVLGGAVIVAAAATGDTWTFDTVAGCYVRDLAFSCSVARSGTNPVWGASYLVFKGCNTSGTENVYMFNAYIGLRTITSGLMTFRGRLDIRNFNGYGIWIGGAAPTTDHVFDYVVMDMGDNANFATQPLFGAYQYGGQYTPIAGIYTDNNAGDIYIRYANILHAHNGVWLNPSAASFTGTGSGTNLTASAVTGTIQIGAGLSGTGVTGGTTIVSQTSGTPGGAGVYVTSAATTSAGDALTTSPGTITWTMCDELIIDTVDYGTGFTATSAGTTALTASAVGGFLQIGAYLNGAGVPANTYIVSGPKVGGGTTTDNHDCTGGAGAYTTNNATTLAGIPLWADKKGVALNVTPTLGGIADGLQFHQLWLGTSPTGLNIVGDATSELSSVMFGGTKILNCYRNGAIFDYCDHVHLAELAVTGNSASESGVFSAIKINANVSSIGFRGGFIGGNAEHFATTHSYNIEIDPTFAGLITVDNVDLRNAVTAPVSPVTGAFADSGAEGSFFRSCPGYNPGILLTPSTTPAAQTVGASPFVYQAGYRPEIVNVVGGTVTAIDVKAHATDTAVTVATSTNVSVYLPPRTYMTIVWNTTAPTLEQAIDAPIGLKMP